VTAIYVGGLFAAKYLIADVGVSRPLAIGVALVPASPWSASSIRPVR
jgi:hypothetical protein